MSLLCHHGQTASSNLNFRKAFFMRFLKTCFIAASFVSDLPGKRARNWCDTGNVYYCASSMRISLIHQFRRDRISIPFSSYAVLWTKLRRYLPTPSCNLVCISTVYFCLHFALFCCRNKDLRLQPKRNICTLHGVIKVVHGSSTFHILSLYYLESVKDECDYIQL